MSSRRVVRLSIGMLRGIVTVGVVYCVSGAAAAARPEPPKPSVPSTSPSKSAAPVAARPDILTQGTQLVGGRSKDVNKVSRDNTGKVIERDTDKGTVTIVTTGQAALKLQWQFQVNGDQLELIQMTPLHVPGGAELSNAAASGRFTADEIVFDYSWTVKGEKHSGPERGTIVLTRRVTGDSPDANDPLGKGKKFAGKRSIRADSADDDVQAEVVNRDVAQGTATLRIVSQSGQTQLWQIKIDGQRVSLDAVQDTKANPQHDDEQGSGTFINGELRLDFSWTIKGRKKAGQRVGTLVLKGLP